MKEITTILLLLILHQFSIAQSRVDSEVIVELESGYKYPDLVKYIEENPTYKLKYIRRLSQSRQIYLLHSDQGRNQSIMSLSRSDFFKEVFPNQQTQTRSIPSDPEFDKQWDMAKIEVDKVWNFTTGGYTPQGDQIVVAVMDDGIFIDHEDLIDNIYINPQEKFGDANGDGCPGICGVDDDGDGLIDEDVNGTQPGEPGYLAAYRFDDDENGYMDDIKGLNANKGTDQHLEKSHGTSVSGIIGARGDNGVGVSGVNWDVKILMVSDGSTRANVIEGYSYMVEMRKRYNESNGEQGAFIVSSNYSLGIEHAIPDSFPVWCSMYDEMGEVGIVSAVATSNTEENIDIKGDMPSLCPSKYMIAVTSTDIDDALGGTAFGPIHVDVAAPGKQSFTITPTGMNQYGLFGGTSSATPHVAGLIGLLYSIPCEKVIEYFKNNPSEVDKIANIVVNSGDVAPKLNGLIKSGKRINALKAMVQLAAECGDNEGLTVRDAYPNPTYNEIKFMFSADPTQEIYYEIYNILGQQISSEIQFINPFLPLEHTVNTEAYVPGLYFFSIRQGKERASYKFIKL